MFTVKTRHASVSNLFQNPQSIQKNKKQSQKSYLMTQKQSPLLFPKLNQLSKTNINESLFPQQISDVKKHKKSQTKQLSMAISKYNLHRVDYLKKPFNQFSYEIMQVLRQFSLVQNNFQDLFVSIYEDLKTFIYLTSNIELSSKYQIKQGESYKKICQEIDVKVNKKLKQYQQKLKELKQQNRQITQQFQKKSKQWADKQKKYIAQIQWYKKISNDQYVKQLQVKIQQLQQRLEELEESEQSLIKVRDQLQKQVDQKNETIHDQLKQIGRLNTVIYDMKIGKQQSQRLVMALRDRFDQLNLKMIGIKEVIKDVQQQNEELKSQRVNLAKRAAVAFEQLTPRPKYNKILNFNQKQLKRKLKSTDQITGILLEKIGVQAYKKQFRNEIFDLKLSPAQLQLSHPKLIEIEHIREKTQSQIFESKSELKQVSRMLMEIE